MGANQPLQRTAGLRFSQFIARLPAAAEFRFSGNIAHIMRVQIVAFLALVCLLLVGCSHSGGPGVRIHSIGGTGHSWDTTHPQPIWSFVITNAGSAHAYWAAGIEVKGGSDTDCSHVGDHIEWPGPEGILAPGECVRTNMMMPAQTGCVWRAWVDYGFTPGSKLKRQNDEWH